MQLDYIKNVNDFGESIVRLYDFDKSEAILFRDAILQTIFVGGLNLKVAQLDFVENVNCTLMLCIGDEDEGILTLDDYNFFCVLTMEGYTKMINLLQPFCERDTIGYQFLYDIDNPIDFLFSPAGTNQID
jgi:hypothetical protein